MPLQRLLSLALIGILAFGLLCGAFDSAQAQDRPVNGPNPDFAQFRSIHWQQGPCTATMQTIGQVQVPAGYKFTDPTGTGVIMDLTQNLRNPKDMGLLCPATFNPTVPGNTDWFLVFVWDDIGFVKDDEKANLNADAILQSLRQGEEKANQERARRGFPSLTLVGWEQPPFYDPQTNHLSWGTRARQTLPGMGSGDTINYSSRILGRGGVMSVDLVIAPHLLQTELPRYKDIIKGYSFLPGQKYAEWRPGDRVAAYGLTALISGGAVAAAAKSGLLGKLGKFIIYIVVAVVAGIGTVFKKLFGRRGSSGA
jgi:uncharacterized membrane-anchored protein